MNDTFHEAQAAAELYRLLGTCQILLHVKMTDLSREETAPPVLNSLLKRFPILPFTHFCFSIVDACQGSNFT